MYPPHPCSSDTEAVAANLSQCRWLVAYLSGHLAAQRPHISYHVLACPGVSPQAALDSSAPRAGNSFTEEPIIDVLDWQIDITPVVAVQALIGFIPVP